jgi:hypothetical protein
VIPDTDYAERLVPRWWAWLLAFGLMLMVAVAYGAALGDRIGWIVAGGGGALVVLLLWVTAPRLRVTADALEVDAARLPRASISSATVVTAAEIRALRGPGSDARIFVALRPWSSPNGVLVRLEDADDPHPAWLFTSRHPARVTDALAATMDR